MGSRIHIIRMYSGVQYFGYKLPTVIEQRLEAPPLQLLLQPLTKPLSQVEESSTHLSD